MNEKQLILNCIQSDRKAQRLLFDRYYSDLFRLAKRYICHQQDTEDVVLVVFNKVFDKIEHFEYRGEGSLKKWINTIAINECIKALRKVRRIVYQEDLPIPENSQTTDVPIDIEIVYRILKKMPEGYRTVFNLHAIEGYSHSEIAELLSISRNTSKSQMLKARKFILHELNRKKEYGT